MKIGNVSVGSDGPEYAPCRFVAEIANAHNGSRNRAIRLIDAAKASGADFVKFQAYTPSELVSLRGDGPAPAPWGSQGFTMATLYEKARTPLEWFPELFDHARSIGIEPFSSVFGLESLAMLERCACPAYKIARLDNRQGGLVQAVLSRGKPVFVSYAGGEQAGHASDQIVPLYCPRGYPTLATDVFLPWFGRSGGKLPGYFGLSSHCMDPLLPVAAVARGAALIEMHFQLDDEPSELEAAISLTQTQFAKMIADVRATEGLLG